jgi:hypothetical protein
MASDTRAGVRELVSARTMQSSSGICSAAMHRPLRRGISHDPRESVSEEDVAVALTSSSGLFARSPSVDGDASHRT